MMDGEDFIFKSLGDRDRVGALIRALLLQQKRQQSSPPHQVELNPSVSLSSSNSDENTAAHNNNNNINDITTMEMTSMTAASPITATEPPPPLMEARMRAQSCPSDMMHLEPSFELESIAEHDNEATATAAATTILLFEERERKQSMSSSVVTNASTTSSTERLLLEAWRTEKQTQQSNFPERAVDGLVVTNCSVPHFFDQFLADDAPHSIASYQQNVIGDSQVKVTKWIVLDDDNTNGDDTTNVMTRTVSFCHPISNNFGVGPSSTMATRKQTLHRYGDFGLCMETSTFVEGVPACDAFHVADRWLVEEETAAGNNDDHDTPQINFTVLHETVFTKRTMFKRMIESSTKTEVKSWYKGYVELLIKQTRGDRPNKTTTDDVFSTELTAPVRNKQTASDYTSGRRSDWSSIWTMLRIPIVVLALVAVMVQNYCLQSQVRDLQVHLAAVQQEQTMVMHLVQAALAVGPPNTAASIS
eukprot:CAMPEP_0119018816 /NCGR_PEP_ID=MMETSP1176-20130426/20283_1 /TAXON_ID=265551 /ORGANISM="Synedropsis recta cf, Strain CCMP1620" /LENGTH=473 /DNA_ID=CAMNT_0006972895 /DNA_START=389 /DNA_END=1813 /DNA_ORIENTATION=+